MVKIFLVTGLSLTLAVLTVPGWAEVDTERAVDIGQITVMAPQPGVEITTEKTIINVDEFKKPGEVRTLTDVLTEIGGVDIQRTNPLLASPGDDLLVRRIRR